MKEVEKEVEKEGVKEVEKEVEDDLCTQPSNQILCGEKSDEDSVYQYHHRFNDNSNAASGIDYNSTFNSSDSFFSSRMKLDQKYLKEIYKLFSMTLRSNCDVIKVVGGGGGGGGTAECSLPFMIGYGFSFEMVFAGKKDMKNSNFRKGKKVEKKSRLIIDKKKKKKINIQSSIMLPMFPVLKDIISVNNTIDSIIDVNNGNYRNKQFDYDIAGTY